MQFTVEFDLLALFEGTLPHSHRAAALCKDGLLGLIITFDEKRPCPLVLLRQVTGDFEFWWS